MAFSVFTDGSANLPEKMLEGIHLLPCSYTVDGVPGTYDGDIDHFDGAVFYRQLREGKKVKTTLLNTHLFLTQFEPVLKEGQDIIYIAMSSGISGTYNAARMAAEELAETYPERRVEIIDSLGCGFGSGLLAVRAAELAKAGTDTDRAAEILREAVPGTCQYFTVDDLNFLKGTGRVSGMTAAIATVLNIKPILFGDETGHIVSCAKVRGRKASIGELAKYYAEKVKDAAKQTVCISHGDCREDAELLAARIKELAEPMETVICMHEPFSGSHVGPGMLGIFFFGTER